MAEDDFSLVIINAPLRDESGEQLALWAAQSTDAGVLLLVKAEIADEVSPGWRTAARWCCQSPSAGSFSASP